MSELQYRLEKMAGKARLAKKVAKHNVYIFGHSLDISDGDILKDLILNMNVNTTIFYFNRVDYANKIANLVKVLGQEELIRRTGGITKTIFFKQQSAMKASDESNALVYGGAHGSGDYTKERIDILADETIDSFEAELANLKKDK